MAAKLVTRHFTSMVLRPKASPDGTSLEEQMNTFLATLPMSMVVDVYTHAPGATGGMFTGPYLGMVIFQENF